LKLSGREPVGRNRLHCARQRCRRSWRSCMCSDALRSRKRARHEGDEHKVSLLAGCVGERGYADGPACEARFCDPAAVALDSEGNVFVADHLNHCIRKVAPDGVVSTASLRAGSTEFLPRGLVIDADGNVIAIDLERICKVTPEGVVSTLAGHVSRMGFANGSAAAARFNELTGVAVDADGNVIVTDSANACIRKLTPDGVVSTLAGRATKAGHADGPAADARFDSPWGVAVDPFGNVIVIDAGNNNVRKIGLDGIVSTIAGPRSQGPSGHVDGPAANARFDELLAVAVDTHGNVIVGEMPVLDGEVRARVRKIALDGTVSTLACSPRVSGSGDGGTATGGAAWSVSGIAIDMEGGIVLAGGDDHSIRRLQTFSQTLGPGLQIFLPPRPTLEADLSALLADELFSDITFAVAAAQVRAHRNILAARSSYFRGMLSSTLREAQPGAVIAVPDISEAAFRALLLYLYSERVVLDADIVLDVMCKAHQYEMRALYTHCMRYAVRNVSISNAIAWLIAAEERHLRDFGKLVFRFVVDHLRVLRERDEFDRLKGYPELMLRVMKAI